MTAPLLLSNGYDDDADYIYVANTRSPSKITHSQQIAHGVILQKQQHQQKRQYIRGEVLQSIANKKFENSKEREGLTYWDLYKVPQYKLAETDKQAQNLLYNAKDAGFLHPSITRTNPQEYFATKDQAELAYINNNKKKKITHLYPTGVTRAFHGAAAVGGSANLDDPDIAALEYAKYLEDLKVNDTASAMYLISSGAIPCGMHKIHIHTSLNPDFISEVYNERLHHIAPNPKNNQAKELFCRIDNFFVKLNIFPNDGAVDIYVPCTRGPFHIDIYDPDTTSANIICFGGQLRGYLSRECLNDYSGRIVPQLQQWYLLRADINFDVPCTAIKYEITSKIQMTKFGNVFRVYKKMMDGKTHIRFEQDKVFENTPPINESIGSAIVAAAREARKELSIRGGD